MYVDYGEIWQFSDEIHKFLGNLPKISTGKTIIRFEIVLKITNYF